MSVGGLYFKGLWLDNPSKYFGYDGGGVNGVCFGESFFRGLSLKFSGLEKLRQDMTSLSIISLLGVGSPPLDDHGFTTFKSRSRFRIWSLPLNVGAHSSHGWLLINNPLSYLISKKRTPRIDRPDPTPLINAVPHVQKNVNELMCFATQTNPQRSATAMAKPDRFVSWD